MPTVREALESLPPVVHVALGAVWLRKSGEPDSVLEMDVAEVGADALRSAAARALGALEKSEPPDAAPDGALTLYDLALVRHKAEGFEPPQGVRDEAARGGTEVGVARARDLSNGRTISLETIGRMVSYFARHEVDKRGAGWSQGEDSYPSAGRIAWLLWGGDAGRRWAESIWGKEKKAKAERANDPAWVAKAGDEKRVILYAVTIAGEEDAHGHTMDAAQIEDGLLTSPPIRFRLEHGRPEAMAKWPAEVQAACDSDGYVKGTRVVSDFLMPMDVAKGGAIYGMECNQDLPMGSRMALVRFDESIWPAFRDADGGCSWGGYAAEVTK